MADIPVGQDPIKPSGITEQHLMEALQENNLQLIENLATYNMEVAEMFNFTILVTIPSALLIGLVLRDAYYWLTDKYAPRIVERRNRLDSYKPPQPTQEP